MAKRNLTYIGSLTNIKKQIQKISLVGIINSPM